jgi:hypothetical protein
LLLSIAIKEVRQARHLLLTGETSDSATDGGAATGLHMLDECRETRPHGGREMGEDPGAAARDEGRVQERCFDGLGPAINVQSLG